MQHVRGHEYILHIPKNNVPRTDLQAVQLACGFAVLHIRENRDHGRKDQKGRLHRLGVFMVNNQTIHTGSNITCQSSFLSPCRTYFAATADEKIVQFPLADHQAQETASTSPSISCCRLSLTSCNMCRTAENEA